MDTDDLQVMEQVIRFCAERGAIHAPEMVRVGVLYSKIVQLIKERTEARLNQTVLTQGVVPPPSRS